MRRPWILVVALGTLVAAGGLWAWRQWFQARETTGGPIILISIDTLRADHLPAYGYTKIRTPQIDRLVADGVLFEQAYTHSPQTLPAHTSILSGRLPFEHGVRDNIGFTVRKGERLVQHVLHDAGYATAGFVSAYVLRHQTGIGQGFDVYDDELPAASPEKPLGQVQRRGADTAAAAVRWIDARQSDRFFVFLHIYEPHRPYTPPSRYSGVSRYDGEVEYSDEIIGAFLDHLRSRDLYDKATIILLSDHGEGLGDHGEDEHGIFLYRETTHVPFIVKLPGSRRAGLRISTPIQHIDVPPTLIAAATGKEARGFRGRSLLPLLAGTGRLPDASIYSESLSPRYHFGWSELYALTDDRYRLIRAPKDELYDVSQDPHERTSIAGERPQVRTAMRSALDAIIANVTVDRPSAVSDEDRQKLAALGYVGTQTGQSLELPGDRLADPKDKVSVLQKYRRATDLTGERRYEEATAAYLALLAEEPEMLDAWVQFAELYVRRGMMKEALAAYQERLKRDPKSATALTGAASSLLRLGRLDEARKHAELAVDAAPVVAHELLSQIAIRQNDMATARREAKAAQAADPTLPLPAYVEGLIRYNAGQYADAIPYFQQARQGLETRTIQIAEVNYYIGDSLARLERYSEAQPYFEAEIRVFPNNLRARAGLAMLYRAMGRDADSEQAISQLIRQAPTREGYDLAAQLWTMFGESARAAAARAESHRLP